MDSEISAYLLLAPVPVPALIPGDIKTDARGVHRCRHVVWLDHRDGSGNWLYILEDA